MNLIGKTYKDASLIAAQYGYSVRVVMIDGNYTPVISLDSNPNRIDLYLCNSLVVRYSFPSSPLDINL
jgi:hypothetical protein